MGYGVYRFDPFSGHAPTDNFALSSAHYPDFSEHQATHEADYRQFCHDEIADYDPGEDMGFEHWDAFAAVTEEIFESEEEFLERAYENYEDDVLECVHSGLIHAAESRGDISRFTCQTALPGVSTRRYPEGGSDAPLVVAEFGPINVCLMHWVNQHFVTVLPSPEAGKILDEYACTEDCEYLSGEVRQTELDTINEEINEQWGFANADEMHDVLALWCEAVGDEIRHTAQSMGLEPMSGSGYMMHRCDITEAQWQQAQATLTEQVIPYLQQDFPTLEFTRALLRREQVQAHAATPAASAAPAL